jgi:hypothetical protein
MPMDKHEYSPINISREDLYDLVWSKPMTQVAKDYGFSDVALAKRCSRLDIPVPGRGYWAQVAAGQKPDRPPLPEREAESTDELALTMRVSCARPVVEQIDPEQLATDKAWLSERLAFELHAENRIHVESKPVKWHPVVRGHRDRLRSEAKEVLASRAAHERNQTGIPGRINFDGWKWQQMQNSGLRLCDGHGPQAFRVTMDTLERALAIVNAIVLAGQPRGFTIRDDVKNGRIVLVGHDAEVPFRITEQLETKPDRSALAFSQNLRVPTGRLRLTICHDRPTLEDQTHVKLESELNRFYSMIHKEALKQRQSARAIEAARQRKEAEARIEATRRSELARIREDEARVIAEAERQAAEEREKRRQLITESAQWVQARQIREYVSHIQQRVANATSNKMNEWCTWALSVADQVDPSVSRLAGKQTTP